MKLSPKEFTAVIDSSLLFPVFKTHCNYAVRTSQGSEVDGNLVEFHKIIRGTKDTIVQRENFKHQNFSSVSVKEKLSIFLKKFQSILKKNTYP